MIKRDVHNLIVQHLPDYPLYLDGGDTASRTGLMAMCGSIIDRENMPKLITTEKNQTPKLIRHPFQTSNGHPNDSDMFRDWTDPRETSRDQLIAFTAGYPKSFNYRIKLFRDELRVFWALYSHGSKWFINKDILLPHYRLTIFRAISAKPPLFLIIFGYPMMIMHLLFSALGKPNAEQNQTIAMLSHWPDWMLKAFCKLHGNIAENMFNYWAGYPFRDQYEIGFEICSYIDRRTNLDLALKYQSLQQNQ